MRVVWPCENSENDPPEYDPVKESAQIKAAEQRLMRKKAAGLLQPSRAAAPTNLKSVQTPERPKRKVKVIRDADGAITGFESE